MIGMRCPWYVAGPLMGLLIIGLRAAVNKPLGALGGYIDIVERATRSRRPGFSAFLLIGVVIGSALYATLTGSYMLLLREADVFLIMGSAIVVAAVGLRLARIAGLRALFTGEPIGWSLQRPELRHVIGSVIFGAGWSVAGTCPGPVAAMIGEGHLGGLVVASGLLAGIALHRRLVNRSAIERPHVSAHATVGL